MPVAPIRRCGSRAGRSSRCRRSRPRPTPRAQPEQVDLAGLAHHVEPDPGVRVGIGRWQGLLGVRPGSRRVALDGLGPSVDGGAFDDQPTRGRPGRQGAGFEAVGEDRHGRRRRGHHTRGAETGHVAGDIARPDLIAVLGGSDDGRIGVARGRRDGRQERPIAQDVVARDADVVGRRGPAESDRER